MQDVVTQWLSDLLLYSLRGVFFLIVLAVSIECIRSAWRHQKRDYPRTYHAVGSSMREEEAGTGIQEETSDRRQAEQLALQQEVEAEEERKKNARSLRADAEAEKAAQRDADLVERLRQARASQQERQEREAVRKAEEARLKKLEELRVREQEVLQAKAARLAGRGTFDQPGQELEGARESERALKNWQDAAFQASLAADRARETDLRRIRAERERIETGAAALAERKQQEKAAWEERKRELRASLPAEPPPGTSGRIALSVRLPSNDTVRRGWPSDASLRQVYEWVDSLPELRARPDEYQLVTTFPRRVLGKATSDVDGRDVLLSELDLYPSAALLVENS